MCVGTGLLACTPGGVLLSVVVGGGAGVGWMEWRRDATCVDVDGFRRTKDLTPPTRNPLSHSC